MSDKVLLNTTIPFFKPDFGTEEEEAVLRVLRSGWLTTGPETLAFETEFAEFTGCTCALAVNSATSGLMLALQALGAGPSGAVITTPYTFVSTASSALHLGARVFWADVETASYNIDPNRVEDILKREKNVRAIVPVHIAGNPCRMQDLLYLGERYGAAIVEDAAHAFPSRTPLGTAGTIGDAGVFSFYATKTITTGEGGMICVKDPAAADMIRRLRSHGIDRTVWDRYTSTRASWIYDVTELGWKFNLPDILSAIGRVQLRRADHLLEQRTAIAIRYTEAFSQEPGLILPPDGPGNAWHLYLLRFDPERFSVTRDELAAALQARGLGISMHFIPHFDFTWYRTHCGLTSTDFPAAAAAAASTISLPFWPGMDTAMVQRVIDTVCEVCKNYRRD